MTIRCPKCGGKRVIFLSTTDGTAVGSTDQRYLCKDCNYRGSLVIEPIKTTKHKNQKSLKPPTRLKMLVFTNLALFVFIILTIFLNLLASAVGLILIAVWLVLFVVIMVMFTSHVAQGSDEWYQYGIFFITGIMGAMVIGLVFGYDLYGITLLIPFAVLAVFAFNWMFTDRSEDAINKDLEKLKEELG